MKATMTYNDIYFIIALINDLSVLKLPAKAMTEKLLLRAHYTKPMREFEEVKESIAKDEAADDEAKQKAVTEKATEEIPGFTPRYFSIEAFEQIVAAAAEKGEFIESRLAAPEVGEDGNPNALGKFPTEIWLQTIAERLVEV